MHKDPNLRRRNALVIPGGLLALWSVVGILVTRYLRGDTGSCDDGSQIVFAGQCRSATLVLAIPLIIGLALLATGALKFRSKATCRLGHGSWTHFGLAFLLTLVLFPLIGGLMSGDATATRGDVEYPVATILYGVAGIGILMLAPFSILYAAQRSANPCCHEKGCFEPCFCDEPVEPEGAVGMAEASAEPGEAAPLPGEPERVVIPGDTPTPADAWAAAPPAEQWEVIPDEPAPAPMKPAPVVLPPPSSRPSAPPLAVRPSDPAAPPADPMAVVAKWAEEDDEAARELAAAGSEPPARRAARLARKPAAKKPAAKPAKKAAKKKS
jgi:hypothetical protein